MFMVSDRPLASERAASSASAAFFVSPADLTLRLGLLNEPQQRLAARVDSLVQLVTEPGQLAAGGDARRHGLEGTRLQVGVFGHLVEQFHALLTRPSVIVAEQIDSRGDCRIQRNAARRCHPRRGDRRCADSVVHAGDESSLEQA